jgi:hypothetical protein
MDKAFFFALRKALIGEDVEVLLLLRLKNVAEYRYSCWS